MLGKISLDYIDLFGNGLQPTIRVNIEKGSSDPRDKLLQYLFEYSAFLSSLHIHEAENKPDKSRTLYLFREDREPHHPYQGTKVTERTEGQTFETAMRWMREGLVVKRKGNSTKIYTTYTPDGLKIGYAPGEYMDVINASDILAEDWEIAQ